MSKINNLTHIIKNFIKINNQVTIKYKKNHK
jgi:hypothetical protein